MKFCILFRKEEESKLQELQAKFLEIVEAQNIQIIQLENEMRNKSIDRLVLGSWHYDIVTTLLLLIFQAAGQARIKKPVSRG